MKQNRRRSKADLSSTLRRAWYHLRLSVRDPTRVRTWDAIVLTAASPEQAELYDWQLKRAKRLGRIAPSTVTLAVPDPNGQRIGSGAATLNAIRALAQHLYDRSSSAASDSASFNSELTSSESCGEEASIIPLVESIRKKHILLLHAGGDSKRVPWANPMGKVFLPLPFMAAEDPDGPVPLLFDHILAIASCARQAFRNEGGIFIMTGDVLPCFDAFSMVLPDDAASIITVPITLDIASNHGVIVASKSACNDEKCSVFLVDNLLQKPTIEELVEHRAILDDGRTLLDTGIIAAKGKAWEDLALLACSSQQMVSSLLQSKKEMSLYEDLVAAWVPSRHEWLKPRPLGEELVRRLGKHKMYSCCSYDLVFLHFGTSSEVLDHLNGTASALVGRRHLCSTPATTVSDIAASAVIISSQIADGVSIGEESLVYDSSISSNVQIGSQSIVVGVNMHDVHDNTVHRSSSEFTLPDRHCLWEVPLMGHTEKVIVYCGLHDNPKSTLSEDGTFCGKPWKKVLDDLGIQETDLWTTKEAKDQCLWNAKIFSVLSYSEMLQLAMWFMGLRSQKEDYLLRLWKTSVRFSLEQLHRSIDFSKMWKVSTHHRADLADGIVSACLDFGLLGRNISQLCEEILQKGANGVAICENFLSLFPEVHAQNPHIVPKSRQLQVHYDLLQSCNRQDMASEMEHRVWEAVAEETASAVRYGFKGTSRQASSSLSTSQKAFRHKKVKVELPVRVDFVGGWSDTPPWSLERFGCVLNMAVTLNGSLPIGAEIETTQNLGLAIEDDAENQLHIEAMSLIKPPFDADDPFRLVKSALLVTDVLNGEILQFSGLRIKTWANVPRGSGLGTSSILSAAVVKALLRITEGDDSNENVARLVLVSEQVMGTGGGWQDQIGGLYRGIKFTSCFPGVPLRLQVNPLLASPKLVDELQGRLLVVFTGQVRLAHRVLQKVVTRYLRRDSLLVSSIRRLIELAKVGREALMNCEIDELGVVMMEAWRLHQELDPHCSNENVDDLFAFCEEHCCGYKLVGAGGGGFALMLCKSSDSASNLRRLLAENSEFNVRVYDWEIFRH